MLEELLSQIIDVALLRGTLRLATPVTLAGLATMLTIRAGMINIAVEGMMLIGAFAAVAGSYFSGSALAGVMLAVISAMLLAFIFAQFSLRWKAHIIIMGIAINIFAGFLTVYLLRSIFGVAGAFSDPGLKGIAVLRLPIIHSLPVLGPLLSGYTSLVYVSWLLVLLSHLFLYKTKMGVHLRAVGENPAAAEVLGIRCDRMRFFAVMTSGALAGLGGSFLSLGHLTMFTEGMSAGRGFVGLAASIFGMGTPVGTFLGSILFGLFDSVAWRLQGMQVLPVQFVQMLPYAIIVIILIGVSLRER
ncbi:MAG: ABC transporter permease [Spirochaetota bacterium]